MAITIKRESAELNIELEKGSTFRHKLTWSAGKKGSELPVDLTGCTAELQVRASINSTDILLTLNIENGGLTLYGATGEIEIVIEHLASSSFAWERGVYGLEVTLANTDVVRLVRGRITAFSEVVR